ncbi:MAG TPA: choice-of-anchor Q domain-containing protein, partial [Aggregatilineales bacterium]|nr:choice-of-anchor Q domain-containing protein [Aggregatilineales bacterium]
MRRMMGLAMVSLFLTIPALAQLSAHGADVVACSEGALRQAVEAGGAMTLSPGCLYTLTMNLPPMTTDTTINGNQAILDGAHNYRLLYLNGHARLTISGLTLRNAQYGVGPALFVQDGDVTINDSTLSGNTAIFGNGGAIWLNSGTLTVGRTTFSGNDAKHGGVLWIKDGSVSITGSTFAANSADTGGAVYAVNAPLSISGSTFSANTSETAEQTGDEYDGGAVYTEKASLSIINSTFSGNNSPSGGGSALFSQEGDISLTSSTLADNTSKDFAAVITQKGTLKLRQTILASNQPADISASQSFQSLGYNLIDNDNSGSLKVARSDLVNISPKLNPLHNGVYTLMAGSPARDAIPAEACATTTDQRGVARPQGAGCDIGAVEMEGQSSIPTGTPTPARSPTPIAQIVCSEAALRSAVASGGAFAFPGGCMITLSADLPVTPLNLMVIGNGTILDGTNRYRFFHSTGSVSISLDHLTVQNAYFGQPIPSLPGTKITPTPTIGGFPAGGAVVSTQSGEITLTNCVVANSDASSANGGAIFSDSGQVHIMGSTFFSNKAMNGGALDALRGDVIIADSAFNNNSAESGGAVQVGRGNVVIQRSQFKENDAGYGGAINAEGGKVTVSDSLFVRNLGGREGGAIDDSHGDVVVTDSIFEYNVADQGGSVSASLGGKLEVHGSTFTGNVGEGFDGSLNWQKTLFEQTPTAVDDNTYSGNSSYVRPTATPTPVVTVQPPTLSPIACDEKSLDNGIINGGTNGVLVLAPGCTYLLTHNLPFLAVNLRVIGNGAAIDGASKYSLFDIPQLADLKLEHLTLQHANGYAVFLKAGALTIDACKIVGNQTQNYGGIVYSAGKIVIANSTFAHNTATESGYLENAIIYTFFGADVFGMVTPGSLEIVNSTLYDNTGVLIGANNWQENAVFSMTASTLTGNRVTKESLIYLISGTLKATQSIIAGNQGSNLPEPRLTRFISGGYNLFDRSWLNLPHQSTDIIADPGLGTFDEQMGSVLLTPQSPAWDAIPIHQCATQADSRG